MKLYRIAFLVVAPTAALLSGACTHDSTIVPTTFQLKPAHRSAVIAPAATDRVMGELSATAQFVSAALEDSATRMTVMRALKASPGGLGLDLQACKDDPAVVQLVNSGERRGAGSARAVCDRLLARSGAVLSMNLALLRRWDGSTLPIIGAIADLSSELPPTIRAYRSPNLLIDLPSDGSIGGPVIMVLPIRHASRPVLSTVLPQGHRILTGTSSTPAPIQTKP